MCHPERSEGPPDKYQEILRARSALRMTRFFQAPSQSP